MSANLKERSGVYYLRKQHAGDRKEISLGTDRRREAQTKAARFLATLHSTGSWDAAAEELRGKKVLKRGESPDFEQMKALYRDYVGQSASPIRSVTFVTNTGSLKRLMDRLKAKTVGDLRTDRIKFTKENRKTIISEIRHAKGIFKPAALQFYDKRGVKVSNPFVGMELGSIKRSQYVPLPAETRKAIWDGARQLPPDEGLVVIMALGIGLRKNECDKARVSWIRIMDDHALFTVDKEEDFEPKSGALRSIRITKELAEEILTIRKQANPSEFDPYILPGGGRGATRKDKTFRRVNEWLKKQGVTSGNPLHSQRKEFGSEVFTTHGVGHTSKILGHADIKLTAQTYSGLTVLPTIDVGASINKKDVLEALAEKEGVNVETLRMLLVALKQGK